MTDPQPSPLPEDIRRLLEEASRPLPSPEFAQKVLGRVKATLGPGGGGPEGGGEGPGGRGPDPGLASARPAAKMGTWGIPVSVAALVGGIGLGLVTGRMIPASPLSPAARPTPLVSTSQPSFLLADSPVVPAPEPVAPVRPERPAREAREPAVSKGGRDVALADERALVELARMALAKREHAEAVQALEAHARRYPRGQLVEERESLWIQTLIGLGRVHEAQRRAAAFRRDFPDSLLQPAVDAALGVQPER